jgi:hypothetical protein
MMNMQLLLLLLAHSVSSLGTALYLNVAIGHSAQSEHVGILAGIQALVILPSVALGRWLGGMGARQRLTTVMLVSDGLGAALMALLALTLRGAANDIIPHLLLGAAGGSLVDFYQATVKNTKLTSGLAQAGQAQVIGAFHAVQAFNLVFAPMLVGRLISSVPVESWAWLNSASYLLSMALVGGSIFLTRRDDIEDSSLAVTPTVIASSEAEAKWPLSPWEVSFLLIVSLVFGTCGVLIPMAGVSGGRGAAGALFAESFYAGGICLSGVVASKLSSGINTRFIVGSFFGLFALSLLLGATNPSAPVTYAASFACGMLLPLLEIYLVLSIRKSKSDEVQVGLWLGRLSSLIRVAMLAGILIYPVFRGRS